MPLPTQRPLWARRSEPSRPTSDPFWRIDNKAGDNGPAEIYLYDEISFWGVSAQSFATELGTVTAKDVTVRVNSPGGDVFDGIAIGNLLASHPATVTVQVDALAASIASVIAVMGADRLVMGPHSQMMIHDASGFAMGNATDMREAATMLDMVSDNIAEVYAVKAGGTPAAWRKTMKAETWYTAQEAVDAGLADEVRPLPERDAADAEKVAARFDLAAYANRPAALFAQAVDEAVDDEPEADESDEDVEPDLEPEPSEDVEPDLDEDAVTSLSAAFMAALNKPIIFDPGTIRAAITMGAVDCPAPTIPVPDEPATDPEPLLALSLGSTIKRATREARF